MKLLCHLLGHKLRRFHTRYERRMMVEYMRRCERCHEWIEGKHE